MNADREIRQILLENIPRDLVLGVEEALNAGAARAYTAAKGMADGHLPHVVGQLRHFQMNEAFHLALTAGKASPTPILGNAIVTGRSGLVALGRFNIPQGIWTNGRRSATRKQMSMANRSIEALLQHDLFDPPSAVTEAAVFFVACFSGSMRYHPEAPLSIQIAVPAPNMQRWLFRESVARFVEHYDMPAEGKQIDLATPTLKRIQKRESGE